MPRVSLEATHQLAHQPGGLTPRERSWGPSGRTRDPKNLCRADFSESPCTLAPSAPLRG